MNFVDESVCILADNVQNEVATIHHRRKNNRD
jgi:hypothetical protein